MPSSKPTRLKEVIEEADEQIRGDTHELPEDIHLEDVGGHDQSEHREGEERKESVVTLETLLTLHIAEL